MTRSRRLVLGAAVLTAAGAGAALWLFHSDDLAAIRRAGRQIAPLHAPLGKPRPGDWLTVQSEPGQTFEKYLHDDLIRPRDKPQALYVLPLGEFNALQKRVVDDTAEFLGVFYGFTVKTLPAEALGDVPAEARRIHPRQGRPQILTKHLLQRVARRRPADAFGVLALTTSDLWAGRGNGYVAGQGNPKLRVGVWSLARNADPARDYQLCLRRSLKTATHETGHMLGLWHCVAFRCLMNGSNSRAECDRTPLAFCPECEQKVWWVCRLDPAGRYRRLIAFAEGHRLDEEARFWRESLAALGGR